MSLFNWFQKKPKEPEAPRPPAPCGDDKTHYFWMEDGPFTGFCPRCARIKADAKEERILQHEAERLAKAIVKEMQANGLVVKKASHAP